MVLRCSLAALALASVVASTTDAAQDRPPAAVVEPAQIADVLLVGVNELSRDEVVRALGVGVGDPPPEIDLAAERVVRLYRREGYSFARATAVFDAAHGTLTITVDEGVIDAVEFTGVERARGEHVRLQAEVWESRPTWDGGEGRRNHRNRSGGHGHLVPDAAGAAAGHRSYWRSRPGAAELRYYLRASATVGTIAERDIDSVGDAVFGRPEETTGLGSLGRTVFRGRAQLSDYLQSVTRKRPAEA